MVTAPIASRHHRQAMVDRILPSTGVPVTLYYTAVIALLIVAPYLSKRAELAVEGLAALAAGAWCSANFWRCTTPTVWSPVPDGLD